MKLAEVMEMIATSANTPNAGMLDVLLIGFGRRSRFLTILETHDEPFWALFFLNFRFLDLTTARKIDTSASRLFAART